MSGHRLYFAFEKKITDPGLQEICHHSLTVCRCGLADFNYPECVPRATDSVCMNLEVVPGIRTLREVSVAEAESTVFASLTNDQHCVISNLNLN